MSDGFSSPIKKFNTKKQTHNFYYFSPPFHFYLRIDHLGCIRRMSWPTITNPNPYLYDRSQISSSYLFQILPIFSFSEEPSVHGQLKIFRDNPGVLWTVEVFLRKVFEVSVDPGVQLGLLDLLELHVRHHGQGAVEPSLPDAPDFLSMKD